MKIATQLTTREVARMFRVSDATVKRWEDAGVIRSVKTSGGHRRFLPEDVAKFIRSRKQVAEKPLIGFEHQKLKIDDLRTSVFDSVIQGNESGTTDVLIRALLSGITPTQLFDLVIADAMKKIGDLWSCGKLTIAQEHLATRTISSAIEKYRSTLPEPMPTKNRVICFSFEGDFHELPTRLAQVTLENAGWEVRNLGASMPIYSLTEEVVRFKPLLICGSSSIMPDADRLRREFAQLRLLIQKQSAKIVLGGRVFSDPVFRERFPCDFFANNFEDLKNFADSIR